MVLAEADAIARRAQGPSAGELYDWAGEMFLFGLAALALGLVLLAQAAWRLLEEALGW